MCVLHYRCFFIPKFHELSTIFPVVCFFVILKGVMCLNMMTFISWVIIKSLTESESVLPNKESRHIFGLACSLSNYWRCEIVFGYLKAGYSCCKPKYQLGNQVPSTCKAVKVIYIFNMGKSNIQSDLSTLC